MKNKIYKTNLIVLQEKKNNLDLEDLSKLPKREIIVEDMGNYFYKEIVTGRMYQSIIPYSLCPFYKDDVYVIMPNEINDRLDNNIKGVNYIKNYSVNKLCFDEFNNELDTFINNSRNLSPNDIKNLENEANCLENNVKMFRKLLKME